MFLNEKVLDLAAANPARVPLARWKGGDGRGARGEGPKAGRMTGAAMNANQPSIPSTNQRPDLTSPLRALAAEFEETPRRACRLVEGLSARDWVLRPAPESWSISEQIVHLNLASRAWLPVIEEAISRGRTEGLRGDGPYHRDFLGWMLARLVEPPVRLHIKTREELVPVRLGTAVRALRVFAGWQDRFLAALSAAEGLALDRIEVASPYDPRLRFNLYSFLCTIPAHQRRHLWLAERTRMILAGADALEVAL